MPQLDPAPWFSTLMLSWLIFLIIIPSKIMGHKYPNEVSMKGFTKPKTESWTWPWL